MPNPRSVNGSTRSVIERARDVIQEQRDEHGDHCACAACDRFNRVAVKLDALLREPTVTREQVEALPDIFVDVALIQFLPDGRYFRRDDVLALFATRTEEPKR